MLLDFVDLGVLAALGGNSRRSMVGIAQEVGCSVQTVCNHMRFLEREFGLRHCLIFSPSPAGFSEFFVRVKFRQGVSVDVERVKRVLGECGFVQFAALTDGDFDLFLWSVVASPKDYEHEVEARVRIALDDMISDWSAHGLLVRRAGFLPVSSDVVGFFGLDERLKRLLVLLNNDSRMSLTDLAKELGVSVASVNYYLGRAKPFVDCFTSFVSAPLDGLFAVRFVQARGSAGDFREAHVISREYLKQGRDFNRLVYGAAVSGGFDNFFLERFQSEDDFMAFNAFLERFRSLLRREERAVVTRVLKGVIPASRRNLSKDTEFLLSPAEMA
ncbi:MAG: AsnC family transcriptional regulator [Candidatus Diapherotrites archaeon]|nr:AsnC family transcriptional regulator [Candidatus Diapherotrites archaeon]